MSIFSSDISFVGVDIGTSSIKIVELKKEKIGFRLSSYGFSENKELLERNDWQKDDKYTAEVIHKILEESGMEAKNSIASLPTFSVFSSVISLANVEKKDMASAVHWEAKKVIPLPLEEMVLDWKIIENNKSKQKNIKVLLTGAPKTMVKKYINIFKAAQLNLLSLETETFSLTRSLLGNDKSTNMIVKIGASTTDIIIVSDSIPVLNRSIDVGGWTITNAISKNLSIGKKRAEQFKYDLGINLDGEQSSIPKTIAESITPIINEIKHVINVYEIKSNEKVEKIILTGGSSLLPNITEYLTKILDLNVIIGNPWARVSCPLDLKPVLDEVGPRMAVAIGLAMRGAE